MADSDSDWALVERVKAGDDGAYEAIMARYKRPILAFVYRMIGDAEEAEDVAQSVFANAYWSLRRPRFRQSGAPFSTWLFRVARNAALDSLRRRRRHPAGALDELEDHGASLADPGPTARDVSVARETGEEIAAAVAQLPMNQRTVLILAEYEHLSCAEIAAILEGSPKAIEGLLYRARQFLRDRLRHLIR